MATVCAVQLLAATASVRSAVRIVRKLTMQYLIKQVDSPPPLNGDWNDPAWQSAEVLDVDNFLSNSGGHRPKVQARVLYHDEGLSVFFQVDDRYVRCVHPNHQDHVYEDSCVEFFVQPKSDKGYVNFEINCGGAMLVHYNEHKIHDCKPVHDQQELTAEWLSRVEVYHSMPSRIEPEIDEPVQWQLQYNVPFALLGECVGPLGNVAGQTWRANFFKCADLCSRPHWASWSLIKDGFNFHQPKYFGTLRFEG